MFSRVYQLTIETLRLYNRRGSSCWVLGHRLTEGALQSWRLKGISVRECFFYLKKLSKLDDREVGTWNTRLGDIHRTISLCTMQRFSLATGRDRAGALFPGKMYLWEMILFTGVCFTCNLEWTICSLQGAPVFPARASQIGLSTPSPGRLVLP